MTRAVIVTGAGGVGKTTLSAAIAARYARADHRTLVLTIDPAKRLADALGVDALGDEPTPMPNVEHLTAAMLDVSASWEAIIHRYADPDVGDRLPAAQAYAAGERMAEYLESNVFDVVVIDTPPSGGGIDFFRAPATTGDLVSGKLLKWLTGSHLPGRSLLYRFTAKPMLRIADTVLGGPMLSDVADFLLDLRTMYDALTTRSRTIERHLRAADTIIATTADPTPLHETHRFFRELTGIAIDPVAIVFNRALPSSWGDDAERPLRGVDDPELRALAKANLRAWASEARRQGDAMVELSSRYGTPLVTVPWTAPPPVTVDDLCALVDDSGLLDHLGSG